MASNEEYDAVATAADKLDSLLDQMPVNMREKVAAIIKKLRDAFHAYPMQGD